MTMSITDFTAGERWTMAGIVTMLEELPANKQRTVLDSISHLASLTNDEASVAAGVMELAAREEEPARRALIFEFVASAKTLTELENAVPD
jgi:hypothetical protein